MEEEEFTPDLLDLSSIESIYTGRLVSWAIFLGSLTLASV